MPEKNMQPTVGKMTAIRKMPGGCAKSIVEPFLRRNGGTATARDSDLFFVAVHEHEVLGSVRFCIEEETAMLRTMMIDETARRCGIGSRLLDEFRQHLEENLIANVYCLPYSHLVGFYARIGFAVIPESDLPVFLRARLTNYRAKSSKLFTAMRRH